MQITTTCLKEANTQNTWLLNRDAAYTWVYGYTGITGIRRNSVKYSIQHMQKHRNHMTNATGK